MLKNPDGTSLCLAPMSDGGFLKHELNPAATALHSACDGVNSIAKIAAEMNKEHKLAEGDVRSFLNALEKQQLIVTDARKVNLFFRVVRHEKA